MRLALETPRSRSRISLTALIDIVFILLLFFMLSSQFSHWQSVDLPLAQNAPQLTEVLPQKLLLEPSGELRGESQTVRVDADCRARAVVWVDSVRPLIVQPLIGSSVQQILAALDCLREAGATRITLAEAKEP